MIVGILAGLSVDHLVLEPAGARFSRLGGPGLYAALGARLVAGTTVRLACRMPACEPRFGALFSDCGIDISACEPAEDVPRVWILNSSRGRRVVALEPRGTELGDEPPADDPDGFVPGSAFYQGLDGLLASSPASRPESAASTLVGVDPHQLLLARDGLDHLGAVCPTRAVLLPSRVQLRLTDADPRAAARAWVARFGVPVVARLDAEGMYVCTTDDCWTVTDARVRVVETTGAGDSSAGAIVAALSAGASPVEAAALGVSVARLAISDWGHEGLAPASPLSGPLAGVTTRKEAS